MAADLQRARRLVGHRLIEEHDPDFLAEALVVPAEPAADDSWVGNACQTVSTGAGNVSSWV
ncbi:MAG TPA: hypothetical protein VGV86_10690 [Acidimicrobiales bacterium]|nr:hypothetical protein [Acidimicrobiales bacterium]